MKKVLPFILLCVLPAARFARPSQGGQSKPFVFTHVTVIDATGAPAKPNVTVVVTGDRITLLGKTGAVRIPSGAQVVDAGGKFLIPGLWDMHVHRADVASMLPLYLANGITGVRDMGVTQPELLRQWRTQVAEGNRLSPRIIMGRMLDGPNPRFPMLATAIQDESQARREVAATKERGWDFVKVYQALPRDIYLAIADEAKRHGIPFMGHVPESMTVAEASEIGQKSIEHLGYYMLEALSSKEAELKTAVQESRKAAKGPRDHATLLPLWRPIDKEALETYSERKATALFSRLKRNHTWVVPTLIMHRNEAFLDEPQMASDPRMKYIPTLVKTAWDPKRSPNYQYRIAVDWANAKQSYRKSLEIAGAMRRAGVELLAGTDVGMPYCLPGFSLHDELVLMVEAGLTPMEALQTATLNPARLLGMEKDLGTVEKGKIADLVLLEANPLDDIRNTQKINAVVVSGRLLDRKALDGLLTQAEAAANQQ